MISSIVQVFVRISSTTSPTSTRMIYKPQRRRGFTDQFSPVEFERQHFLKNETV
ncbi:Uncharacterized protein ToN1_02510 [Aromatoleum petrolei]|nr:Uncharacterized protein ToN1_02510 [Aromatoleum petrolei]